MQKVLLVFNATSLAQASFSQFARASACLQVDIATLAEQQQQEALARLQELLPACRVRPSLLQVKSERILALDVCFPASNQFTEAVVCSMRLRFRHHLV